MRSPGSSSRRLSPAAFGRVLAKSSARPLRHALGFADELHRRCVVNRESAKRVAYDHGLSQRQTAGAVKLLSSGRYSPERLACVVMLDWGMDDNDIAEIFGRSVKWAMVVRSQADEIRVEEPIPGRLEWLDEGLQPTDPSPAEIARRAAELRSHARVPSVSGARRYEVPVYAWRETSGTFIPISAA